MGATVSLEPISCALFGRARREILALLFGHPDESFYLRQIARLAKTGQGAAQRELKRMADAGLLQRETRGRQVYFQAQPRCPVFRELRSLFSKTAGACEILRDALRPLAGRIRAAFLFGSVARGGQRRGSDVDVLVVGDATFGEVVSALRPAQEKLRREVNPVVYPPAEFRSKRAQGHPFLAEVLGGEKIFLIGDERELE